MSDLAYTVVVQSDPLSETVSTAQVRQRPSSSNSKQLITVTFEVDPNGQACQYPSVTMVFEEIDYNGKDEYLKISSNAGNTFSKTCTGGGFLWWGNCRDFQTCVDQQSLGLDRLNPGESIDVVLEVGAKVDDLCNKRRFNNNPYAVVADVSLTCDPTQSPTLAPTHAPTITAADYTLAVSGDTPSATAYRLPIKAPGSGGVARKYTIAIEVADNEPACASPMLAFSFVPVDYEDTSNNYLTLYPYGTGIRHKCGGQSQSCSSGAARSCFSGVPLNNRAPIQPGGRVLWTLEVGPGVRELCTDQSGDTYGVDARVTVMCSKPSSALSVPQSEMNIGDRNLMMLVGVLMVGAVVMMMINMYFCCANKQGNGAVSFVDEENCQK